jgi:hypothetical protein
MYIIYVHILIRELGDKVYMLVIIFHKNMRGGMNFRDWSIVKNVVSSDLRIS